MNPSRFLTVQEKDLVREAIRAAEEKSAGEIRVLIVGRALPRPLLPPLVFGVIGSAISFGILHGSAWGHPGLVEFLMTGTIGLASAVAARYWFPLGRAAKDRAVWKRAAREFNRMGMAKTQGSTGVLLMLSLFEHQAVIYADKGLVEKVPHDTWKIEVEILLAGVKAATPGEGIARAVREVGVLLATHFPRHTDDVNELPDDLATDG
jgi:putative membrane protein